MAAEDAYVPRSNYSQQNGERRSKRNGPKHNSFGKRQNFEINILLRMQQTEQRSADLSKVEELWNKVEELSTQAEKLKYQGGNNSTRISKIYKRKQEIMIQICHLVPERVKIEDDPATPGMVSVKLRGRAIRHFPKDRRSELLKSD